MKTKEKVLGRHSYTIKKCTCFFKGNNTDDEGEMIPKYGNLKCKRSRTPKHKNNVTIITTLHSVY